MENSRKVEVPYCFKLKEEKLPSEDCIEKVVAKNFERCSAVYNEVKNCAFKKFHVNQYNEMLDSEKRKHEAKVTVSSSIRSKLKL